MKYYVAMKKNDPPSPKKNEHLPFLITCMHLESIIQISCHFSYMWNVKIKKKLKQTHRHRVQTGWWLPDGRKFEGHGERSTGIKKYQF